MKNEDQMPDTRVDGVPSDPPMGSTASENELTHTPGPWHLVEHPNELRIHPEWIVQCELPEGHRQNHWASTVNGGSAQWHTPDLVAAPPVGATPVPEGEATARELYHDIGGVLYQLEKLSTPDRDTRLQIARLKDWRAMANRIGWPSTPGLCADELDAALSGPETQAGGPEPRT